MRQIMAEDVQPNHRAMSAEQTINPETDDRPIVWSTVVLFAIAAVISLGVSFTLPAKPPLAAADTFVNWANFGLRILRDILQASAVLFGAIAVSSLVPAIGLFLERLVFRSRLSRFLWITAGISIISSGLFSYFVLDHMPHIQDEIAMVFQAKILASGRLYVDAPPVPEAFDCEFIIADGGRWYGKYFLGQALFLVPGIWVGMPWVVHPLLAGVAVWLTYRIGVELLNEKVARMACVLMAISPFRMSLFGMMLGHASSLIMLAVFALGVIKVVKDPRRWGWALIAGCALGLCGNARPLTALAMGSSTLLLGALAVNWRELRWKTVLAFVGGVGVFAVMLFAYNNLLTGDPLLTPFNQWSKTDRLGFGPEVGLEYWNEADKGHSLHRALFRDLYFNLDVLGANLTGWGRIVLVLLLIPLLWSPWRKRSWMLATVVGSLVVFHFFHVTHGVLAGQARYWSESMPMMMLLLGSGLAVLRIVTPRLCRVMGLVNWKLAGKSAVWLAGFGLTIWSVPRSHMPLIDECLGQFWGQGPRVRDLQEEAGFENAIVFVESGHYRSHFRGGLVDVYPTGFMLNDPDLDGDVVYARDLGEEMNRRVMEHFPGRDAYWINPTMGTRTQFVPLEEADRYRRNTDEAFGESESTS